MDSNRLRYLFERLDQNRFTQEDIDELNEWYHDLNSGNGELKKWFEEAGGAEILAEQLFQNFELKLKREKRNLSLHKVLQIAAALIIISGIGLYLYSVKSGSNQSVSNLSRLAIRPAHNDATITLADGKILEVNKLSTGTINLGVVTLEKTTGGKLIYRVSNSLASTKEKFNTITTPRAGQFEIILPDGTHVWLNAASSLKFPLHFEESERKVMLKGEGYFEVAHLKNKPFKVQSSVQTVTVLGTHFNIKAYDGEKSISTTLFEGSVKVTNDKTAQQEMLKPGRQSDVMSDGSAIVLSNADLDQALSWKNGYFIFDNQDVKSIMTLISRWYDVDVEYHIKTEEHFGGTFSRSSDLKELLKNLESLGKTKFELKERKVIVSN